MLKFYHLSLCAAEYYASIKISNNRKRGTNENKFTSVEKRSIILQNLLCRACRRADAHFSAFTSSINAVSTSSQPAGTGVGAGEGVGVGVPWSESPPSSTTLVKLAFTTATSAEISWNYNTHNTLLITFIMVFWDMIWRSKIANYLHFGENYCFQSFTLTR